MWFLTNSRTHINNQQVNIMQKKKYSYSPHSGLLASLLTQDIATFKNQSLFTDLYLYLILWSRVRAKESTLDWRQWIYNPWNLTTVPNGNNKKPITGWQWNFWSHWLCEAVLRNLFRNSRPRHTIQYCSTGAIALWKRLQKSTDLRGYSYGGGDFPYF